MEKVQSRSSALVVVTTIAGAPFSGDAGTAASFIAPEGICYSETDGSLLVTDTGSHEIRRMYPTNEKRKSALDRALSTALFESDALPIQPLIAIVSDFLFSNRMTNLSFLRSFVRSLSHFQSC